MRKRTLISCVVLVLWVAFPAFGVERLLIINGLLMTMKPGEESAYLGYVAVGANGKISAIGQGKPPVSLSTEVTYDAHGKFIIPGFTSAHSHTWQSAFRGLATDQHVREWINVIYGQMASRAKAEDFYWFTLHGCVDHLLHGITSIYNFTYGLQGAGDFARQQWRGEIDCGARFIHSYARARDVSSEQQHADLADFIAYTHPEMSKPTVLKLSIAGTSRPAEAVKLDAAFMKEFGLSNQAHFLESPLDQEDEQATFVNFVDAGILGPGLSFGHFIHATDQIVKTAAAAGSGMAWNPLSNGRLASGIADIPKYLSLGLKVGMGVDGQASADLPDPFENMRTGLYMIRAKSESGGVLQPIDMLRMHTMGGAQVLGISEKVGSLEVGKFGDILIVDPHSLDRGPVFDPYATLVFACSTENLERVYVGGELLSEYRRPLKHDYAKLISELARRVSNLQTRPAR